MLHSQKTSHIIQTQNTRQNPILTIKLNQNKQIWKKKKKEEEEEEEEEADLTHSSGGEEDKQPRGGGRGSATW